MIEIKYEGQTIEELKNEIGYVEEEHIVSPLDLYGDNDLEGEELLHG